MSIKDYVVLFTKLINFSLRKCFNKKKKKNFLRIINKKTCLNCTKLKFCYILRKFL